MHPTYRKTISVDGLSYILSAGGKWIEVVKEDFDNNYEIRKEAHKILGEKIKND